MAARRCWRQSTILAAFLLTSVFGACQMRNGNPDRDLELALSAEAHPEAIQRIAARNSAGAIPLLIKIAKDRSLPFTGNNLEAVRALGAMSTPEASAAIAQMLVPHNSFRTREAVAKSLVTCPEACVRSVLTYLYRTSHGERNVHEKSEFKALNDQLAEQNRLLERRLEEVLRKNADSTLSLLGNDYGLGSEQPSEFSLEMVERLRLDGACPALIESEKSQERLVELKQGDPAAARHAIEVLECKSGVH